MTVSRALLVGSAFALVSLLAPSAFAQTASTAHHHDGFYLRLGAGPGYLHDSLTLQSNDASGKSASFDGSVKGGGVGLEVAFGGTVAPGLIVGGGIFHVIAFSRSVDVPNVDAHVKSAYGHFLISPVVDYYPDPSGGLHFEGGVGFAISSNVNVSSDVSVNSLPIGFGGFVGAGYERWIADQWALGGLLRVSVLHTKETQTNLLPFFPLISTSDWTVTHTGVDVALLATLTFN